MRAYQPIDPLFARYLAGFFDGEGCIGVYTKLRKPHGSRLSYLSLSIANTNPEVLQRIQSECGGSVNLNGLTQERLKVNGRPRRTLFRWSASSVLASHILRHMLPFLIVKREEALLALDFADIVHTQQRRKHPGHLGKPRLTDEQLAQRLEIAERIKALKRRHDR